MNDAGKVPSVSRGHHISNMWYLSMITSDVAWKTFCIFFFFFESSIIKPTTLNTNEQEAIRGMVADPVACVVSIPPKYQLCSSLGSKE